MLNPSPGDGEQQLVYHPGSVLPLRIPSSHDSTMKISVQLVWGGKANKLYVNLTKTLWSKSERKSERKY